MSGHDATQPHLKEAILVKLSDGEGTGQQPCLELNVCWTDDLLEALIQVVASQPLVEHVQSNDGTVIVYFSRTTEGCAIGRTVCEIVKHLRSSLTDLNPYTIWST